MQRILDYQWHEDDQIDWTEKPWQFQTLVFRARISAICPESALFSADERAKLDGLNSRSRRREFLAVRTFLRQTLALALDCPPEELEFSYGRLGKPRLEAGKLSFNLSHSGDLVLLALGDDETLGVDLEIEEPDRDWLRLARRFFSELERRSLESMDEAQRRVAGYEIWTRKEAVLKAVGSGVFERLSSFSVSSGPEARILECWEGSPQIDDFEIIGIPHESARAAICRRRSNRGLFLCNHASWWEGKSAESR